MKKESIVTEDAPLAIGTYSQAVKVGQQVFMSGQIPMVPETGSLISDDFADQVGQVFNNLSAVAKASGGTLQDIVKLNVYLVDLGDFAALNTVMAHYFDAPYPARKAVEVSALPKGALVEIDAIMVIDHDEA